MKKLIIIILLLPLFWSMQCNIDNLEPNPDCPDQVIISENGFRNGPSDDLTITSTVISGDCLIIEFVSSGCDGSEWEVKLYDAKAIKESYPVQRDLRLSLKNEEECDAVITRSVSFDLRPVQLEYDKMLLNLVNSGDQLLYEY